MSDWRQRCRIVDDAEFAKQIEEIVVGDVMFRASIHDVGQLLHGDGKGFVGHELFDS
jgi:hypothetical protein